MAQLLNIPPTTRGEALIKLYQASAGCLQSYSTTQADTGPPICQLLLCDLVLSYPAEFDPNNLTGTAGHSNGEDMPFNSRDFSPNPSLAGSQKLTYCTEWCLAAYGKPLM